VVFVVADPSTALASRTLVMVTDPDTTNASVPVSDLAEHWRG